MLLGLSWVSFLEAEPEMGSVWCGSLRGTLQKENPWGSEGEQGRGWGQEGLSAELTSFTPRGGRSPLTGSGLFYSELVRHCCVCFVSVWWGWTHNVSATGKPGGFCLLQVVLSEGGHSWDPLAANWTSEWSVSKPSKELLGSGGATVSISNTKSKYHLPYDSLGVELKKGMIFIVTNIEFVALFNIWVTCLVTE